MSADPEDTEPRRGQVVPRVLDILGILAAIGVGLALTASHMGRLSPRGQALLDWLDLGLLAFFLADVALRAVVARARLSALGTRWYDLLALVALCHAVAGERATWSWFLLRQGLVLAAAVVRAPGARRLMSRLWLRPAPLLVGSFAGAIALGTGVLALPISSATGQSIGLVDAFFTATSAVCVTGLIVKNTGSDFTLFGQLVILTLIQLGGLGIMTFSVSMLLMLGQSLPTSGGGAMQDMLDQESVREAVQLVRFIAVTTLVVEAIGAGALFVCFGSQEGYTVQSAYSAAFHAVSAFCNAGFSLYGRSFEAYCDHVGANLVLTSLIILGGLGFPVLRDLLLIGRRRRLGEGRSPRLRTQTKVVLATSGVLIALGAALFYVLELPSTLEPLRPADRLLASYFQSVTARTAGFNTVDIGSLGRPALVALMLLMFIGASPGSTGGGIKTTTAAILFQAMRSAFRRRPEVEFFGRTLPRFAIRRATALVTLAVLLLVVASIAILAVEREHSFEELLFEETSAFGTVGLSTGVTPRLTVPGKLIIIVLMFTGRVGPLTLMFSLVGETRTARYKYPDTHLMVG